MPPDARGWTSNEYVDRGVSAPKGRRPALDSLLLDAKRRRFDVVVRWRLDRLGRNLKHLITLLDELQALGVAFVSLADPYGARCRRGRIVSAAVQAAVLAIAAGLIAGLALSVALNKVVAQWSIGNLNDPVVLGAVSLLLSVVTTISAAIPANRAASIQPADALRVD